MKVHEYQAKELFRRYGIPVPHGEVAFDVERAVEIAKGLIEKTGSETVVVKAQIHAGGRGKGGGVKVVKGAQAARSAASCRSFPIRTVPTMIAVSRSCTKRALP